VDPLDDDHLPPAQWMALILRDVLNWPTADAASLLGVSAAALADIVRPARARVLAEDPGPQERAALARLVGATDHRDIALVRALLREHASPADRRSA
jgi:hypothetical protein